MDTYRFIVEVGIDEDYVLMTEDFAEKIQEEIYDYDNIVESVEIKNYFEDSLVGKNRYLKEENKVLKKRLKTVTEMLLNERIRNTIDKDSPVYGVIKNKLELELWKEIVKKELEGDK